MEPSSARQLDIFADSRDVMLRNDVLHALDQEDAAAARAALVLLVADSPHDPALASLETLTRALETRSDALFGDHDALARERCDLADRIVPAACTAMGAAAGAAWSRRAWRRLAARAEGLAFAGTRPDDHAAALWSVAGAWAEVERAVGRIESWRRIPAPLGWMAETQTRLGRRDDAWPLLAELAWLAPARLDALLRRLDDPVLRRLTKQFDASFEGDAEVADFAWFPAWLAIAEPALARLLALAQRSQDTPPERGLRLVLELLGLERQGRHAELVQRRKSLRDLRGDLYALYMSTR